MPNPELIVERLSIGEGKYLWNIIEDRGDRFHRLGQARSKKRVMEILVAEMDRREREIEEIYRGMYD